jgi:hypothetical protein
MSNHRVFDIFLCHKKSSGKDFADHLKAGLEELGYHTFLDSKDIPKMTDGIQEWIQIRDQALSESKVFILLITPGFDLSGEVLNEIRLARESGSKKFLYFRHRDLGRKIILNLEGQKVDLGRQEQVSFENKEELLRLTHGILLQNKNLFQFPASTSQTEKGEEQKKQIQGTEITICAMCAKEIKGQPITVEIDNKSYTFDCQECIQTFQKFKSVYGSNFP